MQGVEKLSLINTKQNQREEETWRLFDTLANNVKGVSRAAKAVVLAEMTLLAK